MKQLRVGMTEKVPAAPFSPKFLIALLRRGKNEKPNNPFSSQSPLLTHTPPERGVQQKQQTEIELLFQSQLIFRKK